jgi:hypothetical protein
MADSDISHFRIYQPGDPIPPVDPEELKRRWKIKIPWTREALEAAWKLETDTSAVSSRDEMIRTLARYNQDQLLAPWRHGEELHEAVFRIAALVKARLRHLVRGCWPAATVPSLAAELPVIETNVEIRTPDGSSDAV